MDSLAAMTTFVRVVDAGSLSAAARSLPSSLTSVSRQISELEQHFGTRLLLRTTRRLALTEDGRILYERAKSILTEFKEIESTLSRRDHQPTGRLRVSAPTLIGRLLIAPLLDDFLHRFPSLSVDLLLVDRVVDLVEEDIHLSLRVGHLPDSRLVARKIADLQMVLCASPAYLARRGTPQSPADLEHHDCLVFSGTPGAAVWRFKLDQDAEYRIRLYGRIWVNSLDALVTMAKHGAVSCGCHHGKLEQISPGDICNASSADTSPRRPRCIFCFNRPVCLRRRPARLQTFSSITGSSAIRLSQASTVMKRIDLATRKLSR